MTVFASMSSARASSLGTDVDAVVATIVMTTNGERWSVR
jgi:hypothetical protein